MDEDENEEFEVIFVEDDEYPLQVGDIVSVGLTTLANVTSAISQGLHALAHEVLADANHRRSDRDRRVIRREAAEAMGLLQDGREQ